MRRQAQTGFVEKDVKKPAIGGLCGHKPRGDQARKTAINASKNISTPPTRGKIMGAAWAMDSTTSGW